MGSFQIFPLVCLLFLPPALQSQSPAPPVLTVDVNVVTLPVIVRDKHGQIVRNLSKDDFVLEDDGKPQSIRYFSQETNLPLTVGLLVDTSMSERGNMDQERSASKSYLDQMVTTPKDRAFVIHFDREVELLQDLTPDRAKLDKAVGLIAIAPMVENTQGSDQGSETPKRRGASTLLYDAIFLACDEIAKKQTGRKAIVVLSDGEDRGSQETLNGAIESAQRAETVVYTIHIGGHEDRDSGFFNHDPRDDDDGMGGRYPGGRYPGGGYPGGGYPGGGYPGGGRSPRQQDNRPDGKKILQQIAQQTGGRYFQAGKKQTVDEIYASIAEELRTQFMLGYTPPKDHEAGYHSIHLAAKNKDLSVQTREGYYTGK